MKTIALIMWSLGFRAREYAGTIHRVVGGYWKRNGNYHIIRV